MGVDKTTAKKDIEFLVKKTSELVVVAETMETYGKHEAATQAKVALEEAKQSLINISKGI